MHEFNLIQQYFTWDNPPKDISIAVGDDAAVLDLPFDLAQRKQLVTSIDTLISGVHFPENSSPRAIAHKALAVNLSDLAAMGAEPKWFTLALTLPTIDEEWLEEFSAGLKSLALQHQCFLIGGDTTRGPLSISIQVMGFVDQGRALLRSGAKVGDKLYVSGTLGDASAGLQNIQGQLTLAKDDAVFCQHKLNFPTPRLLESKKIKTIANACIDVSDGLLQDLSHILKSSKVGATLDLSGLPFSPVLRKLEHQQALQLAFSGDDYELLFTVPETKEALLLEELEGKVTCIGYITKECGNIISEIGKELSATGYNHFNDN